MTGRIAADVADPVRRLLALDADESGARLTPTQAAKIAAMLTRLPNGAKLVIERQGHVLLLYLAQPAGRLE